MIIDLQILRKQLEIFFSYALKVPVHKNRHKLVRKDNQRQRSQFMYLKTMMLDEDGDLVVVFFVAVIQRLKKYSPMWP